MTALMRSLFSTIRNEIGRMGLDADSEPVLGGIANHTFDQLINELNMVAPRDYDEVNIRQEMARLTDTGDLGMYLQVLSIHGSHPHG
jgi:hypothetical protein